MQPISTIAERLNVPVKHIQPHGTYAAKIDPKLLDEPREGKNPARLILVSAITPTAAGEGKTTTSIGLGDALAKLDRSVCLALREPSLGPCFGIKGGGTGGGRSQLTPADRINLHFTGDFHAITSRTTCWLQCSTTTCTSTTSCASKRATCCGRARWT